MTTRRHRFVGREGGTCEETFGGVARCTLSYAASFHWSDEDHPFRAREERPRECGWVMQNTGSPLILTCGQEQDAPAHLHPPEYVGTEVPVINGTSTPYGQARVTPPDEAAVARGEAGPVLAPQLNRAAQEFVDGVSEASRLLRQEWQTRTAADNLREMMKEEASEWERAVAWLRDEKVGLVYGPWPVRKFLLPDKAVGDRALYRDQVDALDTLDEDYEVRVWRPEGAPWRFALLTWGTWYGLELEALCDELAAQYDRS